jgi:hypothetical protein
MPHHKYLDEILTLDPAKDYERIVFLDSAYEFPFDTTRALEFALFRTYAVPSIGALLAQTGEFTGYPQKRYDDTDLILSTIYEQGISSEHGRAAIRRMNQLHGRFSISNEDFLYVLTTFVFEPIRWNARYGWRKLTEQERLAAFYFWRELGRHMNIKNIPNTYEELERYNVEYERNNFRYTEAGHRVGAATVDLFLSWFLPKALRPLAAPFVYAMLDDPLLEAFGFPKPPTVLRALVRGGLVLRGKVLRFFPARQRPRLRTEMRHRTYPKGYKVEELGPANAPSKAKAKVAQSERQTP